MSAAMDSDLSFDIEKLEAFVFRAPSTPPVRTSFGIMYDRPAVLVRVTDRSGAIGWGEVWCNYPSVGAEHRARLVDTCIRSTLLGRSWTSPQECFRTLTNQLRILSIQTGEPGPLSQVIAGVDTALWDMLARRAEQPLWRFLGGSPEIKVYTSGINPDKPELIAQAKAKEGYTAFKLKVGFGNDRDEENVRALRRTMGEQAVLMVDANQAWDVEQAIEMAKRLAPYNLTWLEEPLPADSSNAQWLELAQASPIGLAAGENLRGTEAFANALALKAFTVIQPDLGKWGGFSGCLEVARDTLAADQWLCPHWLGAGVGLTASMHLKAAVGGPGYVEVDSNPNPLRDLLMPEDSAVRQGVVTLPDTPGLGVTPSLETLAPYMTLALKG
jgi:D-galactarolactone cycloisomerase